VSPSFSLADIESASSLLTPHVKRTPLVKSDVLSRRLGTNIYLKAELFQKTGAFKVRGAFNKMLRLMPEERGQGVVAVSGGNHAQAVAYVGRKLGLETLIFMPHTTPRNYVDATRGYGAEVVFVRDANEGFDRQDTYVAKGWVSVHPFTDPLVMAGQGTIGLEIVEDVPNITDCIVSIGGGGLISGVSTAIKGRVPSARVWGVETEGADCMSRALAAGKPVQMPAITSIARTLGAPSASDETLAIVQRNVESVTVVSDEDALAALRFLVERTKMLTEAAASCTLVAAERLRDQFGPDHHVVLLLCGGNMALADLCHALATRQIPSM
jgi:threonine dehydratase